MTLKKFNALHQLLGSYFHQDWLDEFADESEALQKIIESEPREQLMAGTKEIDLLLASALSEDGLKAILVDDLGCYFDPVSDGMSCEIWLKQVREKFTLH